MLSLIQAIAGRPWAVRAELAAQVHGVIAREGFAGLRHFAELKRGVHAWDDDDREERQQARRGGVSRASGSTIAVVPVLGVLTHRAEVVNSAMTRSTAAVADEVQEAVADPKVDAVVLEIDSPGGEVFGVPEAFAAIREASRSKPVIASANSVAASAALYLASAATEFWVTPSGEAGSLGVYSLHVDASKAIEESGEAWEFVVADESPFKVEGAPTGPLSAEARAEIKKMVNRYMGMFVRDVARGRGQTMEQVRKNFGGGRMLSPQEAVSVKMADRVGTFDEAIRRAAQLGRERRASAVDPAPAAELLDEPAPALSIPEPPLPTTELDDAAGAAARLASDL